MNKLIEAVARMDSRTDKQLLSPRFAAFSLMCVFVPLALVFSSCFESQATVAVKQQDQQTKSAGNQESKDQQKKEQQTQEKKNEKKSLEDQWVDYLLAPVGAEERKKIEATFTEKEKRKLKFLSERTKIKFDGVAALEVIRKLCEMGPRITGSKQMEVQILALKKFFKKMDVPTKEHRFEIRHPNTGGQVPVVNLIATLHPKRKKRIIICCHYDTRPYADQDPVNKRAPLPGANDGASGVGFLMSLAPHLKKLEGKVGIDLVFFDAEEFVFDAQRDPLFIGSERFAKDYRIARDNKKIEYKYVKGVLVDMIADAHLELPKEGNSLKFARGVTNEIWKKAAFLRVREFQNREGHTIRDDHLPLNQIAKIPTCDIIDFDYPKANLNVSYWHTTKDTVDKCSAVSMAKVGYVLYSWAKGAVKR